MTNGEYNHFTLNRSGGVLSITLDVVGRPVNVFDDDVLAELEAVVEQLEAATDVAAVVFRSGKGSGFLAGADVKRIAGIATARDAEEVLTRGQALFGRIQRLPMPTLAVIYGPCLGGGLEFALACRYRIARDDSSTRLGLPEVQLGLLPAWGGTQRLPRLIGLVPALSMILAGSTVPAGKAQRMGLVDRAVSPAEFDETVREFALRLSRGELPQNRRKRSSLTGWFANRTRIGRRLVYRATQRKTAAQAQNYPAVAEALAAVRCGLERSFEEGLAFERAAFQRLLFTSTCRNLLQLFFQRERARSVSTWVRHTIESETSAKQPIKKIGVVGAGAMGAGIAQLAAYQGLEVVVKEIDEAALEAGMSRIRSLFDDAVRARRLRPEEASQRLAAVTPTVDWEPLAGVDFVVEAVVEREEVKREVFAELQQRAKPETLFASNTSSLSIEQLGRSLQQPERLAGLHFFNPVHRMELVEVVRTAATSEETVERLVRLVRRLGKTPVVVGDSPGFLVNRILFPYLSEAVRMACEGVDPRSVDRRMRRFGMPMGPLELLDQVGLDVAAHVAGSMTGVLTDSGPITERLSAMVEAGWLGKKSGRGFYEYGKGRRQNPIRFETLTSASGGRKPPVARNGQFVPNTGTSHEPEEIEQRLVLSILGEAARCLEEGIVDEPWMVDLAMVLGTGFAPFRGGPLRLADERGISNVVGEMRDAARRHGPRFEPCDLLAQMADDGERFHSRSENDERITVAKQA